jgi:RimJ/RimL family protein N-acetyltransferase
MTAIRTPAHSLLSAPVDETFVDLVPVTMAHAAAIQAMACDPLITGTTTLPEPYPRAGAATWIADVMPRHAAGTEYAFAIMMSSEWTPGARGWKLVGSCGLIMPGAAPERAVPVPGVDGLLPVEVGEIGYWVGRKFWGRGLATAACQLLLDFAFTQTPLRAVDAFPLKENGASRRVLEKLGATYEGTLHNPFKKWSPYRWLAHYRIRRPAELG